MQPILQQGETLRLTGHLGLLNMEAALKVEQRMPSTVACTNYYVAKFIQFQCF